MLELTTSVRRSKPWNSSSFLDLFHPPRQINNCMSFSHVCWTVKLTKSFQVSKLWSKWTSVTSQQKGKRHKNILKSLYFFFFLSRHQRDFWLKYENNVKIWQLIWLVCRLSVGVGIYLTTYLLCNCVQCHQMHPTKNLCNIPISTYSVSILVDYCIFYDTELIFL